MVSGETEQQVSGWTVDTLHVHVQSVIDDMRTMLAERYATQTKALDAAFEAQQLAMSTALSAADTAVSKALEAAEKAVIKAEVAADKRFEAVNEFRAQLADQAATFMPRAEAEASINRNVERVQEMQHTLKDTMSREEVTALVERDRARVEEIAALVAKNVTRIEWDAGHRALMSALADLTDRINRTESRGLGVSDQRAQQRLNVGQMLTIVSAVVGVIGLIIAIAVFRA